MVDLFCGCWLCSACQNARLSQVSAYCHVSFTKLQSIWQLLIYDKRNYIHPLPALLFQATTRHWNKNMPTSEIYMENMHLTDFQAPMYTSQVEQFNRVLLKTIMGITNTQNKYYNEHEQCRYRCNTDSWTLYNRDTREKTRLSSNNVRSVREADMFQEIRISQVKQLNVKQYSTLAWGNNIPDCPYCHFRKVLNLLCLADFLVTFANEIKRLRGIQCDVSRLMNRPDST